MGDETLPKLIVTGQDKKVREFPIISNLIIGRNQANHVFIAEEKASRMHCQVRVDGKQILIDDLNSSNGTRVNGRKVKTHALRHGDTVTIGGTTIVFHDEGQFTQSVAPNSMGNGTTSDDKDKDKDNDSTEGTLLMSPARAAEIGKDEIDSSALDFSADLKPAAMPAASGGPGLGGGQSDELIGQSLGGYRIEARLGQGGMGTVYRARQLSMDRDVALKVLRKELAEDRAYVKSFFHEARLAGQCTHPNIVEIHDFGEERGTLYFSMELVEGEGLNELLRREHKLPVARALAICISVAEALVHAAKVNIVHRDIKPQNIMLTRRGDVKVADLGLASRTGKPSPNEKPNVLQGTPHYMSPEHVKKEPIDGRADIYALGVTLFQMLTGSLPFDNDDKLVILTRHIIDPRPDARELEPLIPEAVAKMIQRMMAIEPSQRPENASALLGELKILLGGASPKKDLKQAGVLAAIELPRQAQNEPAIEPKSPRSAPVKVSPIEAERRKTQERAAGPSLLKGAVIAAVAVLVAIAALTYKPKPIVEDTPAPSITATENHASPVIPQGLPVTHVEVSKNNPTPKIISNNQQPTANSQQPAANSHSLEQLTKILPERDRALASGNYPRARALLNAFLSENPTGDAARRARQELQDTSALIDAALQGALTDAQSAAAQKKYRVAMQRCTGLLSSDPSGKFGLAAHELLTKMDDETESRYNELHAKTLALVKSGKLEQAEDMLGKALDELGGTKWSAPISADQLQVVMARNLLKQLEAKRAAAKTPIPIKLATKKLEGTLAAVNGVTLDIASQGATLAVAIKDLDPLEFTTFLETLSLADHHLELANLWLLLDRKDAAQAEVERALQNPEQAAAAVHLSGVVGSLQNLHFYDFSKWQQQSDWEALSGVWSTQNDRYVLESSEGGDTALKTSALGGPFPANNARISFDFELMKPNAGYLFAFEFGDDQQATSAIFSANGIVLGANINGNVNEKESWTLGPAHVDVSISGDVLELSVNGKPAGTLQAAGLSALKGTITFRVRESACAIDNVMLRNVAEKK